MGNTVFSQVEEYNKMKSKILLSLIAIPTLAGSMLTMVLMTNIASASQAIRATSEAQKNVPATQPVSCDLPKNSTIKSSLLPGTSRGILIASSTTIPVEYPTPSFSEAGSDPGEYPTSDFSEAESDAAVALFSCDCPSCISALRQLRTQPLLAKGQGHCWSSLQERVSSQEMLKILQTLDTEKIN